MAVQRDVSWPHQCTSYFSIHKHQVFSPFFRKFILVFFDDILIYSKSLEDNRGQLNTVLELLRQKQCLLIDPSVTLLNLEYLRHVVFGQGAGTDPTKVIATVHLPVPMNLKELRAFLGLTGYYTKFVKNFSFINKPLNSLLKKGACEWNAMDIQAFREFKIAMSSQSLLPLPDFNKRPLEWRWMPVGGRCCSHERWPSIGLHKSVNKP